MSTTPQALPVRAGVFATVQGADQAVAGLLAAGFTREQISVICDNKFKEQHFREFQHPPLPEESLGPAVSVGGGVGTAIGGLAGLGVAATGIGLFVVGPILITGAIVGGFIGAMTSRGVTRQTADFYDQALTKGKILVAVQASEEHPGQLTKAERVFREAGAEPVPLPE